MPLSFPMQVYRLIGPKWLRYLLCAALVTVGLWLAYEFVKSLVVSYTSLALLLPTYATSSAALTTTATTAGGAAAGSAVAAAAAAAAAAASEAARQQEAADQSIYSDDSIARQVSQQALAIQAMGSAAVRRLNDPYASASRALQLEGAGGDGQQSVVVASPQLGTEAAAVQFCVARLTEGLDTPPALPAGSPVGLPAGPTVGSPSALSEPHRLVPAVDAGSHDGAGAALAAAEDKNASSAAGSAVGAPGAAAAAAPATRTKAPTWKAPHALPKTAAEEQVQQPSRNGTTGRPRAHDKHKKHGAPSATLVPPATPIAKEGAAKSKSNASTGV